MSFRRALALSFALLFAWLSPGVGRAADATTRIELPRFSIVHTPHAAGSAAILAATLERERDELAKRMGRDWNGKTEVRVGDGTDELVKLAPPGVVPPPWARGLALPQLDILLLDAQVVRSDEGRQLLMHELAHLALGRLGTAGDCESGPCRNVWPRWFHEGFAMMVAGEYSMSRYTAMYRATVKDAALPLASLTDSWPERPADVEVAYAESLSFVAHLYEAKGEESFRTLIEKVADGAPFDDAFATVYGLPLREVEAKWAKSLSERYTWIPILGGTGVLWFLITVIFLVAYARVRGRNKDRLVQMEIEEKARETALRIAAAEQAALATTGAEPASFELDLDAERDDDPPESDGGPTLH